MLLRGKKITKSDNRVPMFLNGSNQVELIASPCCVVASVYNLLESQSPHVVSHHHLLYVTFPSALPQAT